MHWQLDVTFKEDANTTQNKQAAENLNIIRKRSLSILKMVEMFRPNLSVKKTFCDQYEPDRVFGASIEFLKIRCFEKKGQENNSCVCRETYLIFIDIFEYLLYNKHKERDMIGR